MANNKIQLADGTVLVDMTGVTVTAESLLSGKTALDKSGNPVDGSLVVQKCYVGSSAPDASLGGDGDIYLKI